MAKPPTIHNIPIGDLVASKFQSRTRNVAKDLDELVQNIKVNGQLEPILVIPSVDGKRFEVVAGQRRWLALKQLGSSTVQAQIIDKNLDSERIRAFSIGENIVGHQVHVRDLIDACTALFHRYGSVRAVAEETGLPYGKVRKYAKSERLRPPIRSKVSEGELDINAAIQIDNHFDAEDELLDPEIVEDVIEATKGMTRAQRAHFLKSRKRGGNTADVDSDSQVARQQPGEVHQVIVTLLRRIMTSSRRLPGRPVKHRIERTHG